MQAIQRRFSRRLFTASMAACAATLSKPVQAATQEGARLREALLREAQQPGKAKWQPMLLYLAELHGKSVEPPRAHFRYPFESIGPGYQGGQAFGHIDLTHER